jgi:3-oxoadipate enol-lactonase
VTITDGEARGGRAERSGVEIYYEVHGAGPPIVLVAGLGDDRTSWEAQVADLKANYEVVVLDNRGIGNSTIAPGPYTIDEMAEDCHAVAEELGLTGVTAIGSSMGGAICQRWALAYPDDLARLVLTNTWARRDPFLDALFSHWIGLGERGLQREIAESLLLFCYSPDYLLRRPETIEEFLAFEPPDLDGFLAAAHACRSHHTVDRLDEIAQPTLVIAGEHDILTRPSLSDELIVGLPNAELARLSTGHMIFWEKPDEFLELVTQFLK